MLPHNNTSQHNGQCTFSKVNTAKRFYANLKRFLYSSAHRHIFFRLAGNLSFIMTKKRKKLLTKMKTAFAVCNVVRCWNDNTTKFFIRTKKMCISVEKQVNENYTEHGPRWSQVHWKCIWIKTMLSVNLNFGWINWTYRWKSMTALVISVYFENRCCFCRWMAIFFPLFACKFCDMNVYCIFRFFR